MNSDHSSGSEINRSRDYAWPLWPVLPLYPRGNRKTLLREVVPNLVWTFDQIQGIFYVVVPIRMTVVKLEGGGLLVYAPVAPTNECICLMNQLVEAHGKVQYIILPTTSGLEHKIFVGPFARRFPEAEVFIAPGQWSFPVNLPLSWLGFPGRRTRVLPLDSRQTPFANQFNYEILGPINLGLGQFSEVAFLDRRSHTLLLTDTLISIPAEPPAIVQLDPYPLLFHARDAAADPMIDTPAQRLKGWQRICLFAAYFQPGALGSKIDWAQVLRMARDSQDKSARNYFGLFPFKWQPDWQDSFECLRGEGRLLVAPVLQSLILNRAFEETSRWAGTIENWSFERVVSCHFDSPIVPKSDEFKQAFALLQPQYPDASDLLRNCDYSLPEADLQLLRKLEVVLSRWGILIPPQDRTR
ncbi:MAG: DUF4336 domain-containing protein [Oscillatoriales cyanobacterium RM2_1_1]|nr:DUF4336 domain-containing protein [Oscillatoriales cyanobacterium SM2_3_0]NJO45843.1 DUF4336 domain-containing protein [Oscillatoriales cyanobacterium RM2_1_1]